MADGTLIFDTKLDTTGIKTGLSTLGTFGSKAFSVLKTAATAVATATIGVGVAATKAGASFEAEMSKVAAISGAAGKQLDALTEKAKEMGSKTKFSASESAQAFEYMAMAGWKTDDMLNGIEGVMNLAAASGEDLALTSDIVTDALTAMGYSAGDAGHLADVMAAASSNANTNVAMMGETFKYAASVAGSYGYSMEDVALATGLMANSGIKATQAGTSLRSIFTRLATDAGASSKKLGALGVLTEELGVQFYNTDGSIRDLSDVLAEARVAWKGLNDEEAANYANMIAGKNALSGWLALMNTSDQDFEKLSSAINTCDGAAQNMADTMMDNLQGQITILKSALEGLGISIYGELETPLKDAVKVLNDVVKAMQEGFNEEGISGMIAAGSRAIQDALNQLVSNADFGAAIESFMYDIEIAFARVAPALVNVGAKIFTSIVQGLGNADIINSQILPAISNITTTIVTTFVNNLPTMIDIGIKVLSAIGQGIMDALPTIIEKAPEIIGALAKGLSTNAPQLLTLAATILATNFLPGLIGTAAKALLTKAGSTLLSMLASGLTSGLAGVLPAIMGIGTSIITAIGGALTAAIPILVAALPVIIAALVIGFAVYFFMFTDTGKGIVESICNGIKAAWDGLVNLVNKLISTIVDALTTFVGNVGKMISNLASTVKSIVSGIVSSVTSFVSNLVSTVVGFISNLVSNISNFIKTIFNTVTSFISNLTSKISSFISSTISSVASFISNIVGKVKGLVSNIIGFMSDIVKKVADGLKNILSTVASGLSNITSKVASSVSNIVSKVVGFASTMVSKVKGIFTEFLSIGKNIVTGLWDGISSGWSWLVDKVKNLATSLLDAAKDALGIHSPSKEFEKIGKYCVAGFDKGTEDLMSGDNIANGINASIGTIKANVTGGTLGGGNSSFNQTINVNQQISTPDELARAIRLESKYGLMRGVALA